MTLPERFGVYLSSVGAADGTVREYTGAVRRFLAHAGLDVGGTLPPGASHDPLLRYFRMRQETVGPARLNLEISALRAWFDWLPLVQPGAWVPTDFPKMRRRPERIVRALSDAEVGRLLASPDLSTFTGVRDHFAMATLYQCGLRAGELAGLQLGSVLDGGLLLVHGKGAKDRYVPYGEAWYGLFETYLRQRRTTGPGKNAMLFVTRTGRPLRDARSVWVIVNRHARRSLGLGCGYQRLESHLSSRPWQGHYPHLLRASFASELRRNGCDLMAIAQLLGHSSVVTTALYLGVDLDDLRTAISHHPRARRVSPD
jgi:Site-specific recombinase XerD